MTATNVDTVDTNILIYSIDVSEGEKHTRARRLVDALAVKRALLPLQALNELYFVCNRKKILAADEVESYNHSLLKTMQIIPPAETDLRDAMQLHQKHGLQFFDALLISTAARAGCRTFFTEDMQHGRRFGTMQLVDPFRLTDAEFDQLFD